MKVHFKLRVLSGVSLLLVSACGQSLRADLNSPHPQARINAIVRVGNARDLPAVPLLVDLLEDEDDAVRFYAILALERITDTRLGYDYSKPSWERAKAVRRWREWLKAGSDPPTEVSSASSKDRR